MIEPISPAKLIITGEHAVVYDKRALAIAVQNFARAKLEATDDGLFHFRLNSFDKTLSYKLDELDALREEKRSSYQAFLKGQKRIYQLLDSPEELIPFAATCVLATITQAHFRPLLYASPSELRDSSLEGFKCSLEMDIPIGCGMGSSAAAALAVIKAVDAFYKAKMC